MKKPTVYIGFRTTKDVRDALFKAAEKDGRSASNYLTQLIKKECMRGEAGDDA